MPLTYIGSTYVPLNYISSVYNLCDGTIHHPAKSVTFPATSVAVSSSQTGNRYPAILIAPPSSASLVALITQKHQWDLPPGYIGSTSHQATLVVLLIKLHW